MNEMSHRIYPLQDIFSKKHVIACYYAGTKYIISRVKKKID